MKNFFIWLIDKYQKIPFKSHYSCVFIPTCSQYTKEALEKYGVFKGLGLGIYRVLRCHPWQKNKYDPLL
jgi:hypothetical protein